MQTRSFIHSLSLSPPSIVVIKVFHHSNTCFNQLWYVWYVIPGEWIDGTRVLYADDSSDLVYGSYNYGPENMPGYHIGPMYLNGQVMCCNWLEVGDWNGLYLFVAKNATNFYSFWWEYDRVSDFDYSNRNSTSYFGHRENKYDDGTAAQTTVDDGNKNSCYSLATLDEEAACLAGDDEDCSDEETLVIVLGSLLGVALVAAAVLMWQYLKIKNELAEKNSLAKNAL